MNENKLQGSTSYQIVCFKIGNEEYGVEILQVQEIQKLPVVTALPKSPDYILGVIDLRGKVVPIVDLSKKFKIESQKKDAANRAIFVEIAGKKVGLSIDAVSHVIKVDSSEIEPPPPVVKGISGKYIIGIAKLEKGFVVILDINKIFSQEELTVI